MVTGNALRIVFFGTPAFAVPTLDALMASRHQVVGVVTQPDRPRGRGHHVSDAPVKGRATAAGLPVLLAFSGVVAAIGASAILSHLLAAADATNTVILLVGMAVGVDYSLFYLKREREERAHGADPHTALIRTASTSGHAVLISGVTVLVAVAGMLLSGDPTFESIGLGTMEPIMSL